MRIDAMMKFDVVVVGGGPAGLAAARAAVRSGASVLVLERSAAIGLEVRTSGGSFRSSMAELGVPDRFCHPLTAGIFSGPAESVRYDYLEPLACVLDVRGLYQYLAQEAITAGAAIFVDATAISLDLASPAVVTYRHFGSVEKVTARCVVDAAGYASQLGVDIGFRDKFERIGIGAEYDYVAPNYPQEVALLAVGTAVAPAGYAWAFPWGNGRVRVGVGTLRPDVEIDPRKYLEQLPSTIRELRNGWLEGASPIEYHAGVIPGGSPLKRWTVGDSYVAVGDAGNHASALVGEGIRFAIESGALAGELAAGVGGSLRDFDRLWRRRHGRRFEIAYRINRRIAKYTDDQWSRRVRDLRAFVGPETYARLLASDFSARSLLSAVAERPSGMVRLAKRIVEQV